MYIYVYIISLQISLLISEVSGNWREMRSSAAGSEATARAGSAAVGHGLQQLRNWGASQSQELPKGMWLRLQLCATHVRVPSHSTLRC